MCGIVGFVTRYSNGFSSAEADMFETMLFLDTLRGFDSTGVFGVDTHGNLELHKEACHGPDFIGTKEYKEFKGKAIRNGLFMVGHNRAATRGVVKDINAHPFCVDDKIVLVQNGTMRGDHKKHADVEVDSHAIAHILAKEPDIAKALSSFDAAYALVWYDVEQELLHIIRNSERPLFIAEFENQGFMFASERATILYAAERCNAHSQPKFKSEPYLLPEHTLFTFSVKDKSIKKTQLTITKPTTIFQLSDSFRGNRHKDASAYWPTPGWEQEAVNAIRPNSRDVTIPFSEAVSKSSTLLSKCFPSGQAAFNAAEELLQSVTADTKEIFVEIFDYEPCNKDRFCTRFHMVGKIAGTRDNVPCVLLHYLFEGEEADALSLIGSYASAEISTTHTLQFRLEDGENVWMVRNYINNVQEYTTQ